MAFPNFNAAVLSPYFTWAGWAPKRPEYQAIIDQIQITNQNVLDNFSRAYLEADKQLMTKVARFIDLQPGKILYPRRMMWPLFHEAAEKLVECYLEISPPPTTTNLPPRDLLTMGAKLVWLPKTKVYRYIQDYPEGNITNCLVQDVFQVV